MHRAMCGTAASVGIAVKPAVWHVFIYQEIDNRRQVIFLDSEIGCIVQEHPIKADIALLHSANGMNTAIVTLWGFHYH